MTAALYVATLACGQPAAAAQGGDDTGTIVIVVGAEATAPVPTVGGNKANMDVADLLFLRLLGLGQDLVTAGDQGFRPELARRWSRRDSVTLALELDPRARWHDGRPVTARDVLFGWNRARDPALDPQRALLLRHVAAVTAEGPHTVVVRFHRAYAEQLYDASWHIPVLPAHLLDSIPPARVAGSSFVQAPVGNGPYRWVRRESGRQVVLEAVPDFFLGRPKLERVVFLLARDPEAQLNLLLDGTADALESVNPITGVPRLEHRPEFRILRVPSFAVGYLLFNQRAYGDTARPHPVLADPAVRRAIAMALDRATLVRSAFGPYATVAEGPVPMLMWIRDPAVEAVRYDPPGAAALLRSRGWRDSDGDGVLDRAGLPLALRLNYPGTSAPRVALAPQVQEQLRSLGIRLDLVRLDGPVWLERRNRREFDIDFSLAGMDPSPAGLVQSWSCAGRTGSNVGSYCNPAVDSLIEAAIATSGRSDSRALWRRAIETINGDTPAVFLFAPATAAAVHRRYRNVVFRPEAPWSALWQWSVEPGRQIARDRAR
ncbi:MAG: peptide ABC transporter substrate-binding protein [Dehalococcoidia bacterium]|nr:peptide ABC transporter substrate-binding protein [Dehalococcoidia bacterium]